LDEFCALVRGAAVPCHPPRHRASGFVLCRVTPRPRFRPPGLGKNLHARDSNPRRRNAGV